MMFMSRLSKDNQEEIEKPLGLEVELLPAHDLLIDTGSKDSPNF